MKLLILLAITTLTGVCANHIMQTQNEAMQAQWHHQDDPPCDQNHHGHHHSGEHHHGHHHSGEYHHGHHHILDIHQITEMLQAYLQQGTQSLGKFYQDLGERLGSFTKNAHETFEVEIAHLSRYINENLEKFRRHSFFHKLSAEVHQRLEAIRHDIAQHLKNVNPKMLQEAVGQRIGELRDQLAHTFKHLLQNKIENAQEVSEKVINHLDEFREHWASLVNLYDTVLQHYKNIQEVGMKIKGGPKGVIKGGHKGPMKGGQKGVIKGGQKGPMKGGQKGPMKGGQKGPMKGGQKGPMKGGQKGPMKGGQKGDMKGGRKGHMKGDKKGDCDESSEEHNRRHTQRNVHAWLKAFSKSINQHSH